MKFVHIYWLLFVSNLIYILVMIQVLPFEGEKEKFGFALSCVLLFSVVYGTIVLFVRLWLVLLTWRLKPRLLLVPVRVVRPFMYAVPILTFFIAADNLFAVFPQAIAEQNYLHFNALSMALGALYGGIRAIFYIRAHRAKD